MTVLRICVRPILSVISNDFYDSCYELSLFDCVRIGMQLVRTGWDIDAFFHWITQVTDWVYPIPWRVVTFDGHGRFTDGWSLASYLIYLSLFTHPYKIAVNIRQKNVDNFLRKLYCCGPELIMACGSKLTLFVVSKRGRGRSFSHTSSGKYKNRCAIRRWVGA